jgi:hypothetical protein
MSWTSEREAQDLPWNKITGFIPEMLGFEITINFQYSYSNVLILFHCFVYHVLILFHRCWNDSIS